MSLTRYPDRETAEHAVIERFETHAASGARTGLSLLLVRCDDWLLLDRLATNDLAIRLAAQFNNPLELFTLSQTGDAPFHVTENKLDGAETGATVERHMLAARDIHRLLYDEPFESDPMSDTTDAAALLRSAVFGTPSWRLTTSDTQFLSRGEAVIVSHAQDLRADGIDMNDMTLEKLLYTGPSLSWVALAIKNIVPDDAN